MLPPPIALDGFTAGDTASRHRVAKAFGNALETAGFVSIVNHGVDEAMVDRMYDAATAFFALPETDKLRAAAPETVKMRGYLPFDMESVAKSLGTDAPPDLCEALVFASLPRDPTSARRNIWPDAPPELRACVTEYYAAMDRLADTLVDLSTIALDLPEGFFQPYYAEKQCTLRFVNYPDQPNPPKPGQLRYGAHHDYGGLTILRADTAPGGLQVCDQHGTWSDVPLVFGAFIINVGELLSNWTNGRWRSTLHRVINPDRALTGSTQRLSMVAFTGPNEAMDVFCLPSCQSADNPPRFPPVSAGDFVRAKLAATMELAPAE